MSSLTVASLVLLAFSAVAALYVHFTTKNEKGPHTH